MTPKKGPANEPVQLSLRASAEVNTRADALIEHVSSLRGTRVARSDVLREAILRGLAALERESQR